jgi:hypothetical protein
MPTTGDRCAHECPECGQPMYWSPAAVRNPDLLARTARRAESTGGSVAAYLCANGHTSKECPLCGSYDTAAWADTELSPHYHVICGTCGNDSVVNT